MRRLRLAFAGLAHSHPDTDAAGARERGIEISGVADPDPLRRAEFAARFECAQRASVAELAADLPDVIIATPHPASLPGVARELAATGIPVFFNKCVAGSAAQLAAFDAAVRDAAGRQTPVGTASPLRFAPAIQALALRTVPERVLALQLTVQHDNALFTQPARRWQDDPARGGGTLITVGIHAWELIDTVLPGAELTRPAGWNALRPGSRSSSEDLGAVSGWLLHRGREIPVQVQVAGLPGPDLYRIDVSSERGVDSVVLGTGEPLRELGFAGLLDALAAAVPRGGIPAPWRGARTVVRNTIVAAEAARRG